MHSLSFYTPLWPADENRITREIRFGFRMTQSLERLTKGCPLDLSDDPISFWKKIWKSYIFYLLHFRYVVKLPSLCGFALTDTVRLLKTFPPYSHSWTLMSNLPLFPHSIPPTLLLFSPLSNCLSLRGLCELMHLTQMKEKMWIRVISVANGTVWGVDPLLRTRDFDNAAELKGLNLKRLWLLRNMKRSVLPGLNLKVIFSFCFVAVFSFFTFMLSSSLWPADQGSDNNNVC